MNAMEMDPIFEPDALLQTVLKPYLASPGRYIIPVSQRAEKTGRD
jgi:hypothetical protein